MDEFDSAQYLSDLLDHEAQNDAESDLQDVKEDAMEGLDRTKAESIYGGGDIERGAQHIEVAIKRGDLTRGTDGRLYSTSKLVKSSRGERSVRLCNTSPVDVSVA